MSAEGINGSGIAPDDPLARFIYSSSHFSRDNQRVKHNAFMPGADGKTSVFQTKGLDEPATWVIGEEVGAKRSQTLHARGDIVAADVSKARGDGRTIRTAAASRKHQRLARREKRLEAHRDRFGGRREARREAVIG